MILVGDALSVLSHIASDSIHCVVTSPPYWGLRNYNVEGQLGLEKTPAEYVQKLVRIFGEVRRVLRPDGTCWLNMGDTYSTGAGNVGNRPGGGGQGEKWGVRGPLRQPNRMAIPGLKSKDMVGIPWRVALALQDDGWYLRSDIIWSKTNPMPSSVGDRPSTSHEYVFLLAKSRKYFYDREAVKEKAIGNSHPRGKHGINRKVSHEHQVGIEGPRSRMHIDRDVQHENRAKKKRELTFCRDNRNDAIIRPGMVETRSLRTVWTFGTQAFKGAHFATFPERLVLPCVQAGTSEYGCCGICKAPYRRVIEVVYVNTENRTTNGPRSKELRHQEFGGAGYDTRYRRASRTAGWRQNCTCIDTLFLSVAAEPAIVLDPFAGAGTTGVVCKKLGRNFVGIELNPEYAALAEERISKAAIIPQEETA